MNFIGEYFLEKVSICDKIINLFEKRKTEHRKGLIGTGEVDISVKDSTDLSISPKDFLLEKNKIIANYIRLLQSCVDQYVSDYPECNSYSPWNLIESINIRRYNPGQGFKSWHTERCSNKPIIRDRHLVFMTYLNDVDISGGTEFKFQKKIIVPEKGKTVIWPSDWTHTHRGLVSDSQTKYIITGWFNYI